MENNVHWTPEAPHPKTLTWTNQAKLRIFAIIWVVTVLKPMRVDTWEWPWLKAYFGYTGIMGTDLEGMNLATVIIYDNRELQLHESEWKHSMRRWKVDKGKTIHIGCRIFNVSSRKDFSPLTQMTMRRFSEQRTEPTIGGEHCASHVCLFNFIIIQSVSVVCLGSTGKGDRALSFKFGLDISQEKISTMAIPVSITVSTSTPQKTTAPYVYEVGPYIVKRMDKWKMIVH